MHPISGKSILQILRSKKSGIVDKTKQYVFVGRERHSSSRYLNWGYPQRAIRSHDFLLIWNMKPERWPAGAPRSIIPGTENELSPMYGIDATGKHNPEQAFTDIDAAPSKSLIVENHDNEQLKPWFEWSVARRPEFELFDINKDPFNLKNLAGDPAFKIIENELKAALIAELKQSGDPRVVGPDPEIFDSYVRYSPIRDFPKPK
jgi:uncharacterized sulfatase